MVRLRNSLLCLFLGLLCVLTLRLLYLADQASIVIADAQSIVAPLNAAAVELHGAAREQRSYYKATGKALFIATRDFARLVQNADSRLDAVTSQLNQTLAVAREGVALVAIDTHNTLGVTAEAVNGIGGAARNNFEQMEKLWPPLEKSATGLAASAENTQQATESIKLALEPLRKPTGRLKFILKWLLGLPHINIP